MKGKLKKLFINHGEKIGMAVVALIVIVGMSGADWSPYKGTPGEITSKVRDAEAKWTPAVWPEEEAKEFEIKPEDEPSAIVASNISNSLPLSEFALTQKFVRSPYETVAPLTNPEWKKLEEPIATAGRVLLAVVDEEAQREMELRMQGLDKDGKPLPAGTFPGAPNPMDDNIPDEFRQRPGTGLGGPMGADGLAPDAMALEALGAAGGPGGRGRRGKGAAAAATAAGVNLDGLVPGMSLDGTGMPGMPTGGLPPGQKGRGFHYVSVRAVFPVRDQIVKLANATNIPEQQAGMALQVRGDRLERQTMQESGDRWGGPWEPVDINVSADVLTKMAVGLEPDVIYAQLTDPAMTMPLPARVSGVWRNDVTHPRIEKFTLTPAQIQQEVLFQQEALRQLEEMKKELPPPPAQKGGWSQIVVSGSALQNMMMGASDPYAGGYGGMGGGGGFAMPEAGMGGMGAEAYGGAPQFGGGVGRGNKPPAKLKPIDELMKMKDKELKKELESYIEKAVQVVGELLLFRYIDFSVEPGKTYRYRASLVFRNPNFLKTADLAAGDTSVVTGETRTSDWSDATSPVTVPKDQQSFVTDVKPAGATAFPVPQLNVFQWDATLGSMQQAVLPVNFGQTISGRRRTDVLDPAKGTFELKEYTFQSTDYVVDAQTDIQLEAAAHPDVKPAGGTRGDLMLPERVLVALSEGGVAILDPSVSRQAELDSRKYLEYQNKRWKEMKDAATAVPDGMAGMEGMEGMYDAAMTYGSRGFNPLSNRGGKRGRKAPAVMP